MGSTAASTVRAQFVEEVLWPALRAGRIKSYDPGLIRFRVRSGRWFTPDFAVSCAAGPPDFPPSRLALVHCDLALWDPLLERIQDAADCYPQFAWLLADRVPGEAGRWRWYRMTDRGITANPVGADWIEGAR